MKIFYFISRKLLIKYFILRKLLKKYLSFLFFILFFYYKIKYLFNYYLIIYLYKKINI